MDHEPTPEQLAEIRKERSGSTLPPDRTAAERTVEAEGQRVPVRIIRPDPQAAGEQIRGVYLNIAGGGFFVDETNKSDDGNARLADALGIAVVSVHYRLAPEDPWPAAPDDCETAALWVINNAQDLFQTDNIVIGGSSAGANLAMTTMLRLRERQLLTKIADAVLKFGAYDLSGRSPGGKLYGNEWFVHAYAGHVADRSLADISPLFADLRELPPALLLVGEHDVLLEDSRAMAARLSEAGCDATLRVYPDSAHGFHSFSEASATAATTDIEAWIADRLR